jgi:hypothetical protein
LDIIGTTEMEGRKGRNGTAAMEGRKGRNGTTAMEGRKRNYEHVQIF